MFLITLKVHTGQEMIARASRGRAKPSPVPIAATKMALSRSRTQ